FLTPYTTKEELENKSSKDIFTYINQMNKLAKEYHVILNKIKSIDINTVPEEEEKLEKIVEQLSAIPLAKFQIFSYGDKKESSTDFRDRIELLYREAQRKLLNIPLKEASNKHVIEDIVNTNFLNTNHYNVNDLEF